MADDPKYYKINPKKVFSIADVGRFIPGRTYWVTPGLYNTKLDDGSTVADNCASAMPTESAG